MIRSFVFCVCLLAGCTTPEPPVTLQGEWVTEGFSPIDRTLHFQGEQVRFTQRGLLGTVDTTFSWYQRGQTLYLGPMVCIKQQHTADKLVLQEGLALDYYERPH